MPEPSATPATPDGGAVMSDAALIQQIAAEARSSGQSLVFDPEAPDEGADGEDAPAGKPPGKAKPPEENSDAQDQDPDEEHPADGEEQDPDEGGEDASPQGLDAEAVTKALKADGGVDMVALAKALGVDPEALKVTPATHAALRVARRKADTMIAKATDLSKRLNEQYGDQVAARKAAAAGELDPAITFIENTFGMSWNELNKMVGDLMQGKPAKDIEQKRELRELKKRETEREEAAKKAAAEAVTAQKVSDAKAWIANSIKGDKLATPELNRQLSEAGFPTITDLVFEAMQQGYKQGITDPKKALEQVKLKLTKQAKALQFAGLTPKPKVEKKTPLTSTNKPRADAQTGAAGNARPMTDRELREAVLREAGLWR